MGTAYTLLLPAFGILFFINIIPLFQLVLLSFTNASLSRKTDWVGFSNYLNLFLSGEFISTFIRTFFWMILGVVFKILLGFIGALLLNAQLFGKNWSRSIILPPWVVPVALSSIVWTWLYNGQFGLISNTLQRLGFVHKPVDFLGGELSSFFSVLLVDIWAGVPMITIFLIAALEGVSESSLEAAYLEGASRWQRFWYVVYPETISVLLSLSIITAIFTFNSFDVIWTMTQGGPLQATTTLPILSYKTAIGQFQFGYGAAQAVVMSLALFFLGGMAQFFRKRLEKN